MKDVHANLAPIVLMGILVFIIGFFIIMSFILINEMIKKKNTDYEMPNGVICENDYSRGFSNNHEFSNCDDGKNYLNPEYWKEIKKEVTN